MLSDRSRLLIEVWDTVPPTLGAPVTRVIQSRTRSPGRGLEIIETPGRGLGLGIRYPAGLRASLKVWAILKIA